VLPHTEPQINDFSMSGGSKESNSFKRTLRKMKNLKRTFLLRRSPMSMQEATLKTVFFGGHVVIVVKTLASTQHLVGPLRKNHEKLIAPIVVMCSSTPSSLEWDALGFFPNVYLMLGDSTVEGDLARVNIQGARQVLISMPEGTGESYTRDAATVFVYQHIRAANPGVRIMLDFDTPETMSFLARPER
jgi:hypothetical protein